MGFKFFYIVLQCVSVALAANHCRETSECQKSKYGRTCTLPSPPERTALIGDRLYVGVTDDIVAYSLHELEVSDCVTRVVDEGRRNRCVDEQGRRPSECRNFIRVIQPISGSAASSASDPSLEGKILVCGTNAYTPKCTLHAIADLSNYVNMTDFADHGFCPYANTVPNVAVLATNGRFFSGTTFQQFSTHRTIGMAPKPLQRNNTFTAKTPRDDPLWLNQPDFVSAYEVGDYIYFFAKEIAYEFAINMPIGASMVYSRAFRVSKEDPGITSTGNFLTFQKARMKCTSSGERNTIPYDYDNLKATFLWQPEGTDEQILYGAFSSPVNGPEGAAVCKFSFDDNIDGSLSHVFGDGLDSLLVATPATPLDPQPLHVVAGSEFTQIAVDVVEYHSQRQEILYYSLSNGELKQCVITQSGQKYEHIIHNQGQSIHSLVFHKGPSGGHELIAVTNDTVISFTLGHCSRYTSCWECMDTKDPYCAWDGENNECINKLSAANLSSIHETVSIAQSTAIQLCGPKPDDPTPSLPPNLPTCSPSQKLGTTSKIVIPQPEPTQTSNGVEPTEVSPTCIPASPHPEESVIAVVGQVKSSSSEDFSIAELAGATLGGFVIGVPVGLIICAVFFVVFIKKRTYQVKRRDTSNIEHQAGVLRPVNNQLEINAVKKEQCIRKANHYVDAPINGQPGPVLPEKKNVNEYEAEEGSDDVLTELPSVSGLPPRVLQKPKGSGRGRTDSTRALMHSVSSESSESPPLNSPT